MIRSLFLLQLLLVDALVLKPPADPLETALDGTGSKQVHAFRVSPQDKADHLKVDEEDKFHVPTVAPNDRQADVENQAAEDLKNSQTTRKDSEKGSKGSVILADYDSNRLGVSADEAKTGTKEDKKDKAGKNTPPPRVVKTKPKKKNSADVEKAVNDNKASNVKEDLSEPVDEANTAEVAGAKKVSSAAPASASSAAAKKVGIDIDPSEFGAKTDSKVDSDVKVDSKVDLKDSKVDLKDTKIDAKIGTKSDTNLAADIDSKQSPVKIEKPAGDRKPTNGELEEEQSAKEEEEIPERDFSESKDSHFRFRDSPMKPETEEPTRFSRLIGAMVMIVVSEIGDKTFFIAALMAMRHNQWFVFSSSYAAMFVMTVMSMVLGLVLPTLLSRKLTTLLAAGLFFVFAAKMLREAWGMDRGLMATEELEEVEQDLAMEDRDALNEKVESGGQYERRSRNGVLNLASLICSPVWIQIFSMTFLAEWGDRSQIATVAMGAGEGFMPVLIGCLVGHFITTAIAVLGGKILAKKLSLKTITFSGAMCFVLFGLFNICDWWSQLA